MDRYSDLDTVLNRVWRRIERAAEDPGAPFRTLTFGTVQDAQPQLRTVVLRAATRKARRLAFHTDRRAEKVEAIRANDRIAWHAWDPDTLEQVRLRGTATIHADDEVADEMWATQAPSSLAVYPRPPAPGTSLDAPGDGLQASATEEPITREDVADGRQYFAVVRTVIDTIDWLHLHPEGHYRARFQFDAERTAVEGSWIVP